MTRTNLAQLVARLRLPRPANADLERVSVGCVVADSRDVTPGALFVAVRGEHVDGHDFVSDAVRRGAGAVVVEANSNVRIPAGVVALRVDDTRRALSAVAAEFYGDPSFALDVVGVTGTNGKTTTTRMIEAVFDAAGVPCGTIGTVGARFGSHEWSVAHTTPLPSELHALLAGMRDAGARAVAVEVSSHALALDRVEDVRFRCGVLTNVTRDHLDFHGTQEAYAAAKRRLFDMAEAAVLNADDAYGAQWATELRGRAPVKTYAIEAPADVVATDVVLGRDGSRFSVGGIPVRLGVPARFNVANALAAVATARLHGIDDSASARGLEAFGGVAGRMERIAGSGIEVVVDYAHTPDALEQALRGLRECSPQALAVVFGCGGDRDRGKRAEMGRVAATLADRIYVTNDNPRTEEPRAIATEIEVGIGLHDHVVELDRRTAIERAVADARSGDVVLVAGKGHEKYQIVGDRVLPFDDAAAAREALARRS